MNTNSGAPSKVKMISAIGLAAMASMGNHYDTPPRYIETKETKAHAALRNKRKAKRAMARKSKKGNR